MSYSKRGIDWLEDMPVDIKMLYFNNIDDEYLKVICQAEFNHFVDFLSESFIWSDTPEGYEFWLSVSQFNFYSHETR